MELYLWIGICILLVIAWETIADFVLISCFAAIFFLVFLPAVGVIELARKMRKEVQ